MSFVCETCRDTHAMDLNGAVVMCTKCPTPCADCRSGGNGPYCSITPCPCNCHNPKQCLELMGVDTRLGELDLDFLDRKAQERIENGTNTEAVWWSATRAAINEIRETRKLLNTPLVDDFFAAVRNEAAHQVERWGVEHDADKRSEDWITLFVYLLGKAAKAHFAGDRDKLLHHIITVAAVALNWHRNATGENTRMRPGVGP